MRSEHADVVLDGCYQGAAHAVDPASARSSQKSTVPVSVTLPSLAATSIFSGLNQDRFSATMMSSLMSPASTRGLMVIWLDTPLTPPRVRTAIGVGIGALLGLIAGPIGVAAGVAGAATLATGTAMGVGALAGGAVGVTADAVKEDQRENAASESFFTLRHGQSAVVAEVTEDFESILDEAMKSLGGTIYRRENNAETNAAFGAHYYGGYMYPYYYDPMFY
jgi:hypothetical protein